MPSSTIRRLPTRLGSDVPVADLDIYRSANVLVKQHGEDAPIHAAMIADLMLDRADLDGYAIWRRILRAVGELQGTVPKPGEAVH